MFIPLTRQICVQYVFSMCLCLCVVVYAREAKARIDDSCR